MHNITSTLLIIVIFTEQFDHVGHSVLLVLLYKQIKIKLIKAKNKSKMFNTNKCYHTKLK